MDKYARTKEETPQLYSCPPNNSPSSDLEDTVYIPNTELPFHELPPQRQNTVKKGTPRIFKQQQTPPSDIHLLKIQTVTPNISSVQPTKLQRVKKGQAWKELKKHYGVSLKSPGSHQRKQPKDDQRLQALCIYGPKKRMSSTSSLDLEKIQMEENLDKARTKLQSRSLLKTSKPLMSKEDKIKHLQTKLEEQQVRLEKQVSQYGMLTRRKDYTENLMLEGRSRTDLAEKLTPEGKVISWLNAGCAHITYPIKWIMKDST